MNILERLLRRNTSAARIAGFIASDFIGLAIMAIALQFYLDFRNVWNDGGTPLNSDYLTIHKRVGSLMSASDKDSSDTDPLEFTEEEIADLQAQEWVDSVAGFRRAAFKIYASLSIGDLGGDGREGGMSTAMFAEGLPEEFLDVDPGVFGENVNSGASVPIVIPRDYLALYNFGFASGAGLPKLSDGMAGGLPLSLTLVSDSQPGKRRQVDAHIAGYTKRYNTILVPDGLLETWNRELGIGDMEATRSQRLAIHVNSPGDKAIAPYLESRGWEMDGDKSASAASYVVKVGAATVMGIGLVITLLSLLILGLSLSLLMEKNRKTLHSLLMLGYSVDNVGRPYRKMVYAAGSIAGVLAFLAVLVCRHYYYPIVEALGGSGSSILWGVLFLVAASIVIVMLNVSGIRRRIFQAWV